ncbi:hypothetical protein WKI68_02480 [Streptomyces sp. MS1.HAVA.3]|uniref:Uncharacterized protein n=1 Tax=Streptomyces caledonius TaxID=3134107 RepID=A0ABU8TZA9_9ACTN
MISTQQIAGENAALDLMPAHLTHNAEAIASATAGSAACPTTAAYARRQLCGLLHDAVLARPDFSLHRPAVLGPAGRAWLQHVAMHGPLADTVLACPRRRRSRPRHHLNDTQWIATYAISAVARLIDVYGPDETPNASPSSGTQTPSLTSPSRSAHRTAASRTARLRSVQRIPPRGCHSNTGPTASPCSSHQETGTTPPQSWRLHTQSSPGPA